MVHLAEKEFYDAVYNDAAEHDVVVVEGVNTRVSQRLTRSYRWIKPERLGLVVQPKFQNSTVPVVHGDLDGEEFQALWDLAPWRERALLEFGAGLFGIWLRMTASRTTIGQNLSSNDLQGRDQVLAWTEERAHLMDALHTARDAVLLTTIAELLSENEQARSIGVVFGAAHMGPLVHNLISQGFATVESRWMKVFEA